MMMAPLGVSIRETTVPITPPTLTEVSTPEGYRRANRLALRNPGVLSLLGLCALSMPVGLDACGMPVGLMLAAAPRRDQVLLAAAQAIEGRLGTSVERLGLAPMVAA